jgi:hypothetical protein
MRTLKTCFFVWEPWLIDHDRSLIRHHIELIVMVANMIRRVVKILFLALILSALLAAGPVSSFMPSDRGASYPDTVWSERGIKGSVSGKVVTSLDQALGVSGAYVAVVDAMNPAREYANTTSGENGDFQLSGLSATYSSALLKGPDGSAGSYSQGTNAYMIYVNKSPLGEGYSGTFGIDTNHTSTATGPVVIYAGSPDSDAATVTPEPTITVMPTVVVVTPVPMDITMEPPSATPGPTRQDPIGLLIVAALVILVIAAIAAYFRYLRKK